MPVLFTHLEADFEEFVTAGAAAAKNVGIIVYNTFWTATNLSFGMVERLARIPNIVGLKWATPRSDAMEFEDVTSHFSDRFTIIDNNLFFPYSSMPALGARAFEVHLCNYWPEWGVKLIDEVRTGNHSEIARMMVEEAMPFYKLWTRIEREYTSGDGYLDKLCMELIGLPSSRCRPPTRDIRKLPGSGSRDAADRRAAAETVSHGPARQYRETGSCRQCGVALSDIAASQMAVDRADFAVAARGTSRSGTRSPLQPIAAERPIVRFGMAVGLARSAIAGHAGAHPQCPQPVSRQRGRPL